MKNIDTIEHFISLRAAGLTYKEITEIIAPTERLANRTGKVRLLIVGGSLDQIIIYLRNKTKINIFAKLIFENINTNLIAPYPYLSEYRNPITGKIETIQEIEKLNINANYLNFQTGTEWYFDRRLYLTGGLLFSLNINEESTLIHSATSPGFDYPKSIIYSGPSEGLTILRYGFFAGIGMTTTLPIWNNYLSLFTEITYSTYLNDVITNGNWNYSQIAINIGIKYNYKSIF